MAKHKLFKETFPEGSDLRNDKLQFFKKSLKQQQNIMSTSINADAAVTKASYEVCYILGKHMEPFTDAEIIEDCFLKASEVLFEKFSNKQLIISQIKKMPLSDSTCVTRIEVISKHICCNVVQELQNCKFFSLTLDSSTDISATSQCSLFVRYCSSQDLIHEELLKFLPMKGHTRGSDYLDVVTNSLEKNKIDVKKLTCVCTDGCPAMTGSENGFISLLKKKYNLQNLVSLHCIIAASNAPPELDSDMKAVVGIVNFIRARELNHIIFKALLKELRSEYSDVLLHNSVRWLSRGKVLKEEITVFLLENNKFISEIKNNGRWGLVAFLCNNTEKLNNLNLRLQGGHKIVSQVASKIFAFEQKLNIFSEEIKNQKLHNFPTLMKAKEDGINISVEICAILSRYLFSLCEEFKRRFQDLRKLKNISLLIENPWHLETSIIPEIAGVFDCNYAKILNEFIDLKNDTHLEAVFKEKREVMEYAEFWKLVPEGYQNIRTCAQKLLTFFASTYLCEAAFSKMK